jgi:hypothetical protein
MTSHRLGADAAAISRNNSFDFILSQLISEHSLQSHNRHTPFLCSFTRPVHRISCRKHTPVLLQMEQQSRLQGAMTNGPGYP